MSSFAALRNDNARLLKENASLRQRCRLQAQEPSELNEAKECVVSVAFDDTNGRRDIRNKYKAALQTFLHPLHTKYQITTECLSSPQPCKFLLWVADFQTIYQDLLSLQLRQVMLLQHDSCLADSKLFQKLLDSQLPCMQKMLSWWSLGI